MSHFGTFGRPKSVTVVPETGTLGALDGVVSFSPVIDPETISEVYSDSRQPCIYEGNDVRGCTIVTKDARAFFSLKKNARVTSVNATIEGAIAGGSSSASVASALDFSLEGGYVSEAVVLETNASGTPSEMAITIMVCRDKADGSDGTVDITPAGV